nr:WD repeat-containing protein 19 [Polyrhizophydium stewartii]
MKWSPSGDCLAAIQSKSLALVLWDAVAANGSLLVDTGMKNMELLCWSADGDLIAVATSKGNLFLYDRRSGKKVPVIGKHTKGIVAAAWSPTGELACASADKSFSLSNRDGDTTFQMGLKGEATNMQRSQWTNIKNETANQHLLSMVVNSKSILVFDPQKPQQPIELAFNARYGTIAKYKWFKENQILVGFASGYLVVVSTNPRELGQELFQSKSFKDSLGDIAVSKALNSAATCGDSVIKIHDLSNLQDVSSMITLENERGLLTKLQFSDDGQFLTVSTKDGSLYIYLSKLPTLGYTWHTRAYLTSLSEVAVADFSTSPPVVAKCETSAEPQLLSLGPKHLAVSVGSKVRYHTMAPAVKRPSDGIGFNYISDAAASQAVGSQLSFTPTVWERDYGSPITALMMVEQYAVVLVASGELHLHPLEDDFFNPNSSKAPLTLVFPEDRHARGPEGEPTAVTCAAVTNEFMIFATSLGLLLHYDLDEILMVNEFQHSTGIKAIYPRPGLSTKLIFVDTNNKAFIMSPLSDSLVEVPSFPATTKGVLWETAPLPGRNIFVTWDDTTVVTYIYTPSTVKGPQCRGVHSNTTHLPFGLKPVLLLDGVLKCQTAGGKLEALPLATHVDVPPDVFLRKFQTDVEQGRALRLLYLLHPAVSSRQAWTMLAEAALHSMDILVAKRVYRQILNDAGMVMNLTRIESVEERVEMQGHIAVIFGDFNMAQQYFLTSSNPKEALFLRRDLLEWDQALTLAARMAPEEVPVIAREYAIQLEMDGNPSEALVMYEKALATPIMADKDEEQVEHERVCVAGLTRMAFRTGDIARGMAMLAKVTEKQVLVDCAGILETLKQYLEAALILERGGMFERAAELWIKLKNWGKITKIIDKLNSPKIFLQYARAKEAEQQFVDAASAYERAKDYDNVARVLLENLNDIEGAAILVRKTRSRESAKMMTKAFQAARDFKSAVEFYLIAGMPNEAFEIAKSQDVVEHFAELVQEDATNEMLINIAVYFQNKGAFLHAGRFYLHASRYPDALKMFLQCPVTDGTSIDLAIETVGHAKSDSLTHELIDYLMGETDGIPKDAKYIFKLYMSLGQFKEAARTAIIIAREEQVLGNYRTAHDLLLDNYRQLKRTKAKVPAELDRMLMLLHSYMLVKTLVRIDEHVKGARMLMRVSNNISRFPSHVVPILTSTVVECHRAGLKKEAFDYAAMLMRPEYRQKVDAKFKRKIEQIVRRPEKEGTPEPTTPCPFCANMVPETTLDCDECKNHLPYCIATGQHMVLQDWCVCPTCEFPAIAPHFKNLLEKTGQCPMCSETISPDAIRPVDDPEAYLRGKKNDIEDAAAAATPAQQGPPGSRIGPGAVAVASAATAPAQGSAAPAAESKQALGTLRSGDGPEQARKVSDMAHGGLIGSTGA